MDIVVFFGFNRAELRRRTNYNSQQAAGLRQPRGPIPRATPPAHLGRSGPLSRASVNTARDQTVMEGEEEAAAAAQGGVRGRLQGPLCHS